MSAWDICNVVNLVRVTHPNMQGYTRACFAVLDLQSPQIQELSSAKPDLTEKSREMRLTKHFLRTLAALR
jgi:hypothetical protein